MSDKKFVPALNSLEYRLAPAAVTMPPADVVQDGEFDGQFGDQTTPDAPGTGVEDSFGDPITPGVSTGVDASDPNDAVPDLETDPAV